jgi:D-arabinitol 4-dehydrogenase
MDPAVAHAICEAADPVAAFCADLTLWGSLANDERLINALRQAFTRVNLFIKNHQK